MNPKRGMVPLVIVALIGTVFMARSHATAAAPGKSSGDVATKQVDRGRYMSMIGGCNDCHTPGYMLSEGQVPEKEWLTGDQFGWRGPWGTTYGSNLRLIIPRMTESQWVTFARSFKAKPPMPWFNLNKMHEEDLRAIHRFVKYLGPGGEAAPAYVPPGREPDTPYALFPSPPKEGSKGSEPTR